MPTLAPAIPAEKIIATPAQAACILSYGGILIYPTETFYAIGCMANNQQAVNAIFAIKNRPLEKPLPLLAGSISQAALAVELGAAPIFLIQQFWPGPLTLVLPAMPSVAQGLRNVKDRAGIRVTSCDIAAGTALAAAFPIVSTSANLAGRAPATSMLELDIAFISALEKSGVEYAILAARECGKLGKMPSTIVEPIAIERKKWKLHILREGAIESSRLRGNNFEIVVGAPY